MLVRIGCIVEGHGEVSAVPVLLRRIAAELDSTLSVVIPQPLRVGRGKLVKAGELERAVELTAREVEGDGAVVVVVDADHDCPAELGPLLLQRVTRTRPDLPVAVILAKREFETWFLAAAESLRGHRGLPADLTSPADPEGVRGAKEWLSVRIEGGGRYVETLDQPKLAAVFDFSQARRADSFDKCYREMVRVLNQLRASER